MKFFHVGAGNYMYNQMFSISLLSLVGLMLVSRYIKVKIRWSLLLGNGHRGSAHDIFYVIQRFVAPHERLSYRFIGQFGGLILHLMRAFAGMLARG